MRPEPWTVIARNLPEHAGNAIHTDDGARAAGFPSALVAGVTTYAYLVHPVIAALGLEWVRMGGAEVRFHSPVFAGDTVTCAPSPDGDLVVGDVLAVGARVDRFDGALAEVTAQLQPAPLVLRDGEPLPTHRVALSGQYSADYAQRAGDDLDVFSRKGIVHPAAWPALANYVFHRDLVRGAWVHTRSVIRHHALAAEGAMASISGVVVDRFERRSGTRAVAHLRIDVDGQLVATLEHEAIIQLP